jgi:hypothetical protein
MHLIHSFIHSSLLLLSPFFAEVKIEREHVQGSATGETKPEVEPITEETVKRMENPGHVEVCKSSSTKKN